MMGGGFGVCCVYRLGNAQSVNHRGRCFERSLSRVCGSLLGYSETMTKLAKTTNPSARWEWIVYTPMVLSAVAAFAVLLAQSVIWLKTTRWVWIKLPDVGIQFPLERMTTDIIGANKTLAWLSNDAPLFLWLVLIIPLTWRILTAITERVLPNQ
jgi:hypothetical protein